jgi:hypothetical protein
MTMLIITRKLSIKACLYNVPPEIVHIILMYYQASITLFHIKTRYTSTNFEMRFGHISDWNTSLITNMS